MLRRLIFSLGIACATFGFAASAYAASPALGVHVLFAQNDTFGTDPATTPPVTTQASGSTLLALSMGWLRNLSNPTDTYNNSWSQLSGPNIYFSSDFYTALWDASAATGGSGHRLTFQKDSYPAGEISMAMIEVKDGGRVNQVYRLAPSNDQSPGSITVDGPATLIAIWGGDSGALDHTAVPDNGFSVIDSYLDFGIGGETAVQVAIAAKQVTTAGTYTVKWTSNPTQNCACYLVAVQNSAVVTTNLIANPSVETAGTGGNPASWLRGGYGTNTRAFTYPVTGNGGGKAVKVAISSYASGDAKWYFTDVPVTPGETYFYSDTYQADAPSSVQVRYRMTNGTYTYSTDTPVPPSAGWMPFQKTFTVPAGVTSVTVFHRIAQVGSLTTDSFSLVKAAPGSNLISNPSMETGGMNGNPTDWFRGGYGTNTRTYTYPVTGEAGARASRVDVSSFASGDAKWYFADVPVTPGLSYAFSDFYQASVPTSVQVRYRMTNGTYTYGPDIAVSAAASFTKFQQTFTVPANVVSLTVFHRLKQNGSLATDDFSLIH